MRGSRRFVDEELRHIIVEELVEVIRTDHDQYIWPGPGQRLAVGHHLAHPLVCKVGLALRRRSTGTVEEWVVGGGEDSDKVCHNFLLWTRPAHTAGVG
jgi:hypothetical protein